MLASTMESSTCSTGCCTTSRGTRTTRAATHRISASTRWTARRHRRARCSGAGFRPAGSYETRPGGCQSHVVEVTFIRQALDPQGERGQGAARGRGRPPHLVRKGLAFWIDNEGGDDAGGGRETGAAGGKPARTAVYLAEVGVRVHIHLHFAELQVAEGHQREGGTHRIHAFLHDVGRTHGLLEGAVPSSGIHFPAEVAVLVAVIVVGLEGQE